MEKRIAFSGCRSLGEFVRLLFSWFFDDSGVREALPLTGNEIVTVMYKNSYRTADTSTEPYFAHFNIFDIEEEPEETK